MGSFATGVTIITTRSLQGEDIGVTANSFNSVSLDPPMVLWSLAKKSRSLDAFMRSEYFAVHVMSFAQMDLSASFAKSGTDKFNGVVVDRGLGGIPLLRNCSARFQCRRTFVHEGGDHLVIIGQVEAFDHEGRPPLVFHSGDYALAVGKGSGPLTESSLNDEPHSSFSQDFLIYLLGRAHQQLFSTLRRDLERHGLTEDEWVALSVLGVSDHRKVAELDRLLWYTGKRVSYELFARLAAIGFVELRGGHDPGAIASLTPLGRKVVIELVAAAKAAEADAERSFGKGETLFLKNALRAIIRDTIPVLPRSPSFIEES